MDDTHARLRRSRSRRGSSAALAIGGALFLLATAAHAEGPPFRKGPYLQSLGQTGVTIKMELSVEASKSEPPSIEITGPDGKPRVVSSRSTSSPSSFYPIRVDGLEPATSYSYVAVVGSARSERGQFTTAPPDDRPFRFVLYGDSRSDHATHAAVVRAIEGVRSDFLLSTGDLVYKGDIEGDWQAFFDVERSLLRDRCLFAAVGNHELATSSTAPPPEAKGAPAFVRYFGGDPGVPEGLREAIAPLYRSFRWSNTRFFILNAMDSWTGPERAWLRDELDRSLREPGIVHRVAVLHHGPYSSGKHGANKRLADGDVVTLMRERRVDLLFAGHDHVYERGEGRGLKYIVSGGAGAPLYKREKSAPETEVFESVHHFVEVSIDGDRIETVAHRASGGIIERCTFKGDAPWSCSGAGPSSAPSPSANPTGARVPIEPAAASSASCACGVVGEPHLQGSAPLGRLPWVVFGAGAIAIAAVLRRPSRVRRR